MSALLSANEIRLTYGYQTLLDGVTLAVSAGEKTGMVGRNGCGKTSLLKILTGQQMADSGEISLRRALRVGYLPQEFELDSELSVQENIAAGAADIVDAIRRYENGEGSDARPLPTPPPHDPRPLLQRRFPKANSFQPNSFQQGMKTITKANQEIAKTLAGVFGGTPKIARYWDDNKKSCVDIITVENAPQQYVASYGTIGLSDHALRDEKTRVEFVGACGARYAEFANIVATTAFCVINSKWAVRPGAIFPNIVRMYRKDTEMQHIWLCPPFLWEKLTTLAMEKKTVAWLLLVPISEREYRFAEANGSDALEDVFVEKQIDVFNLERKSVV